MKKSTWRKPLSKLVALTVLIGGVGCSGPVQAAPLEHMPAGSQSNNEVRLYNEGSTVRYEANSVVDSAPVLPTESIAGGFDAGSQTVENNTLISTADLKNVIIAVGASGAAGAVNNKLIFNSGTVVDCRTYLTAGFSATGHADNNEIIINGGRYKNDMFSAGYTSNYASGNIVTINDGTFNNVGVYGSEGKDAVSNKIIINGGSFVSNASDFFMVGGLAENKATGNIIEISGDSRISYTQGIIGGYGKFEVNNNQIFIHGGKIKGFVIGGLLGKPTGTLAGNTIIFSDIDRAAGKADIVGEVFLQKDDMTILSRGGGILKVYNSGNKVDGNLYADKAEVNFYIHPEDMDAAGSKSMLEVSGTADITKSQVRAGVLDAGAVKKGDKVNLIKAGTLKADDITTAVLTDGMLNVDLQIAKDGNNLVATAGKAACTESAKLPVEGQAATLALINSGADIIANEAFNAAAETVTGEAAEGNRSEMAPFVTFNGGSSHLNTGSYVDMKSWNITGGFVKEVQNNSGKLMFGPIIEYGSGSYDAYVDNGSNGDGNSSFFGIGFLAKQTYKNDVYLEGSLRGGHAKNELNAVLPVLGDMSYDNSANYYGAHIGVGKVVPVGAKDNIDYYGKLFYTHQNGSSATLKSGHHYDFDGTNSFRTKLGFRYNHKVNDGSMNSAVHAMPLFTAVTGLPKLRHRA